jgi:hypothetical protein
MDTAGRRNTVDMAQEHPGLPDPDPGSEPPTQELKIIGKPRIEETDEPAYSVHIELSRKLTLAEQDAVAGSSVPIRSPAGWVKIYPDRRHLTVTETTIEKVAQHQDSFREIVSKIAAQGEENRKRAVEAKRRADETDRANEEERARRRKLADEIDFGKG